MPQPPYHCFIDTLNQHDYENMHSLPLLLVLKKTDLSRQNARQHFRMNTKDPFLSVE